jgi:hypothetical protein
VKTGVDVFERALSQAFKVYDTVEELRLAGAEAFLHPDIERLIKATEKYRDQFSYVCIVTNGTYVPRENILKALKDLPCDKLVRVDDYGDLSPKVRELVSALKDYGIPYDLRGYSEEEQFYGGWIDLGNWVHKDYSEDELEKVYRSCRMPQDCHQLWENKLINCPYCVTGWNLGRIPIGERDVVDLFDSTSIEEKRSVVEGWKDKPFVGCQYCNGYDPENSPRIPAAEQM